ncbi:TlpA disulfide reductase family protein [Hoyosella subflava]|uniref:Possible thioredoxin n=1 Tax=Hoyosella subflava (strain DSM 45089 / JCM 17490 / NBRC 109087 / DQS3-9A1) TaxID=443218 RepID=F6EGZ6_HOYSD|nr:TlpA disulfide reductase family protein [Hoyosella subflava]AEF38820.1 Possible thioredoxin [Hoyosella subflava DQS3-9A1]
MRSRRRIRLAAVAVASAAALTLSACATAGTDAVVQGGTFNFVSPGGQTEILYDPPESRGTIGMLMGPSLADPDETIELEGFAGQVVVLNVWGQWCAPCRTEMPELQEVYDETKELGVQFLGINVRDPQIDKAQDFVTDFGLTFPSIYDPSMRTLIAMRGIPTSVVPMTFVLDREHRVAAVFLRDLLVEDLQPVVERVAQEE